MAFLEFVRVAAVSVGTFLIFIVIGVLLGRFPRPHGVLHRNAIKVVADLVMMVFFPCFFASSLGQGVTLKVLEDGLTLWAWALIHISVGLCVGFLFRLGVRLERHFEVPFILAATFGNSGSLPLVLIGPLTQNAEALSGDSGAYDQGVIAIFLYNIVWQSMYWGVGAQLAQSVAPRHEDEQEEVEKSGCFGLVMLERFQVWWSEQEKISRVFVVLRILGKAVYRAISAPPMISIFIGILIGLTVLKTVLFHPEGALFPLGSVISLLGQAAIPGSNLVLAGSIYHGMREAYLRLQSKKASQTPKPSETLPIVPQDTGAGIGNDPPKDIHLKDVETTTKLSEDDARFGDVAPPPSKYSGDDSSIVFGGVAPPPSKYTGDDSSIVFGGVAPPSSKTSVDETSVLFGASAPTSKVTSKTTPPPSSTRVSMRTVAALCITRLIVVPGINIALYILASYTKIPVLGPGPQLEAVARLVVLVEAVMPSAQFVLLILQQTQNHAAAEDLSTVYLPMYPLALFTMAAWLSLVSYIVFVLDPQFHA